MQVQMALSRVLIMEMAEEHIVELREVDGERFFSIMIGRNEAAAIERRLLGQVPPRPQTHELLASVIEALGARPEKVLISELKHHNDMNRGIFHARLFLRQGDKLLDIDARPSDAIALGAATDVPIYVDDQVLEAVMKPE